MATVFEYEGADDAPLKQEEAKHNARDPTGTAARLLLAGRRQRALQGRPKFYDPEQQYVSPFRYFNFLNRPDSIVLSVPEVRTYQ